MIEDEVGKMQRLCAGLAVALVTFVAGAATAYATVTTTNITAPSDGSLYLWNIAGTAPQGFRVSGTAVPGDTAATYFFQYGKTNRYGHQSAAEPLGAGAGAIPVNAKLSRLTAHAGYHYRLVATNRAGTSYGADKQFKTRYALRGLALKVVRTGARGYHASGALKLPGGVSKAIGCKGTVTITARHYSRKAGSRTARVTRRCTYSANLSVDLTGRSKISIVATFNGNPTIGPFTPRGVTALFAMQHPRHAPLAAPWSPADEQLSTDRFRPSAPPLGGRPTGRRHHWNYANSDAPEFR